MALQDEIEAKSKDIHTDAYSISIGEIISLYKEGDLNIHPEFQRFFRWEEIQKAKLIESILLGFPIPPIFVAMRSDGIWDVVDGVQRLSTILQFVGVLKDSSGNLMNPLRLLGTRYLPSLAGKAFEDSDEGSSFTDTQRRYFKRAKLSIIQVLKESDPSSKYELFQRLNTGGTIANSQEIRNCILVMENQEYYERLDNLAKEENFISTISISDRLIEERYDLELLVRFLVLRKLSIVEIQKISDLSEYLNDEIIKKLAAPTEDWDLEVNEFKSTFEILNSSLGSDSFRRFNPTNSRFSGGFIVSAFEIVAFGIGFSPDSFLNSGRNPMDCLVDAYRRISGGEYRWAGQNTAFRLQKTIPLGRITFQNGGTN